jgi:hypothetical protein
MKEDLILLNSDEDRVQGLSCVELNASEEDPISEESQGDLTQGDAKMESQQLGLVKCTNVSLNEQAIEAWKERAGGGQDNLRGCLHYGKGRWYRVPYY